VHLEVPSPGREPATTVDADQPLTLDLRLESLVSAAIVASGRVRGRWRAVCSRCLTPLEADFDLALREVFRGGPDPRTRPIPSARTRSTSSSRSGTWSSPELPLVPLCDEDCQGLCPSCGANLNEDGCDCGAS